MEIMKLQKSEIADALDLVWTVFQQFEAPDYTDQGIEEFKSFIQYDTVMEKIDKGALVFWGCKEQNQLVGVIAVRGMNHICLLFVKKEYHRMGIAKRLFEATKDVCRTNDMKQMTVNSSPYATGFYHRIGFSDTDTEKTVNGMRFTPMVCLIEK